MLQNVRLGPYKLIEQIGEGGFGIVYQAHRSDIQRTVALKVLRPELQRDHLSIELFEREAHINAGLLHKRTSPIYDYGRADNHSYYVMRYMRGGTLRDAIQRGNLTVAQASNILSQIAEALDHIHSKGIVHLDPKPSNILMDTRGYVYLADFGVAMVRGEAVDMWDGRRVGTPYYLAPEIESGTQIDRRADVFTLGLVLYEMITGNVPEQEDTQHIVLHSPTRDPLPPFAPGLPLSIQRAIEQALDRDPIERPRTAGVLAEVFNSALQALDTDTNRTQLSDLANTAAQASSPAAPEPEAVATEPDPAADVFISYRRADSSYAAGHIFEKLAAYYGRDKVFKDIDAIPLGADFRRVLDEAVASCRVLLAVIGLQWLSVTDDDGKRRIDDYNDYLRIEIKSALKHGIPIIPLLVDGASQPNAEELPSSLYGLAQLPSLPVRPDPYFQTDIGRLVKAIDNIIASGA